MNTHQLFVHIVQNETTFIHGGVELCTAWGFTINKTARNSTPILYKLLRQLCKLRKRIHNRIIGDTICKAYITRAGKRASRHH